MHDENFLFIIGKLASVPSMTVLPNGMSVAEFSLAVNDRVRKSGAGKVSFLTCRAWGKVADGLLDLTSVGDGLIVRGSLRQDRWKDRVTHAPRSLVYVNADWITFLPRVDGEGLIDIDKNESEEAGP